MIYRELKEEELNRELFLPFERRQVVKDCWRLVNGQWLVKEEPFIDQWSEQDYGVLIDCLRNTVRTGGVVFGAFWNNDLKGFASVEGKPFGVGGDYMDLTCLHVSEDRRRVGIGRKLFIHAADWARDKGARKLYISSHSAVETQAFYRSLGCVEAREVNRAHMEQEPYDCQLEFLL